jgi:predicted nuclease of predicted toxin-antitoxin system
MTSWLAAAGCGACHTLDLPDGNRVADGELIRVADAEQRILITKDTDFVDSHLLRGQPAKLLLISTGNISNRELEAILLPVLSDIVREFATQSFLELGRRGLVVRS